MVHVPTPVALRRARVPVRRDHRPDYHLADEERRINFNRRTRQERRELALISGYYLCHLLISIALCFVIVGFVLLPIVAILGIVFPIIAAVKANEGRAWKYPLAIPFIS